MTNHAIPTLLALLLALAGVACLYLASPRPLLLASRLPSWAGWTGLGLLAAAVLVWGWVLSPATTFFATLSVAMCGLILLPALVALGKRKSS